MIIVAIEVPVGSARERGRSTIPSCCLLTKLYLRIHIVSKLGAPKYK